MYVSVLRQKSFEFAVDVVVFARRIQKEKAEYILSKQLIRSGTSIGANIRESRFARSRIDFIHKLKISLKEAEESEYWLMLIQKTESHPVPEIEPLLYKCQELIAMLVASLKTLSKQKALNR